MATLAPGEKARMFALGGLARGGATRGGYVGAKVFIDMDGAQVGFGRDDEAVGVLIGSLTITDNLDETANSCAFTVKGTPPPIGQRVRVTLGSKNSGTPLFAGTIIDTTQGDAANNPRHVLSQVSAIDDTWLFNFTVVTKRYVNQSASLIALDLVAQAAATGFTSRGVVVNLPVLAEFTVTNEPLGDALTRLARRIGAYWYVDYNKDVHLFFEETGSGVPTPLTVSHPSLAHVRAQADRSQALTRVYVEGRGSRVLGAVAAGDTLIPVAAIDMFTPASDVFLKVSFQGAEGGAQHLTYTGVVAGGAGSLVGQGIGPPGAPTLALAVGAGLSAGTYQYAYTDTTATGETKPSPAASVVVGTPIAAPIAAPVPVAQSITGGLTAGTHSWAITYLTAGGETTPGPASAAVSTLAPVSNAGGITQSQSFHGGPLLHEHSYWYRVTWIGAAGGETVATLYGLHWFSNWFDPHDDWMRVGVGQIGSAYTPIPAGVVGAKLYRSWGYPDLYSSPYENGPFYYVGTIPLTAGSFGTLVGTFDDHVPQASLGAVMPTANDAVAHMGTMRINLPFPTDPLVTVKRLYRTVAGGADLKLVATPGAEVASFDDATPDGGLGAAPPTTNTAGAEYRSVAVSAIAVGPSGTTGRKLYRTAANGADLKLHTTIANNTTTTVTDTSADGSLGATAPATDTSGLTQAAGNVSANATAIVVANPAAFPTTGGWAVIGNGEQVIRYAARSSDALTGIPASGIGSITAAINYNSTVTAAPLLTGIGGLTTALTAGDEVYLVVRVDDTAAQAQLAADLGVGPGIREEWVQDRRLSIGEARARGLATLALRPLTTTRLSYTCRDLRTAAGKTITVSLGPPTSLSGTYKIQQVIINNFRPYPTQYPTFAVQASSTRFGFEDLLRLIKTQA